MAERSEYGDGGWLAEFAARSSEFGQESLEASTHIAQKWGERSLQPGDEWTVDTVTADMIEAWEYLTPLLGRGLDLGLEALQRLMRPDQWDV